MNDTRFAQVEAILFVAGSPLELTEIADILNVEIDDCRHVLESYSRYLMGNHHSALCLKRIEEKYVLSIKEEHKALMNSVFDQTHSHKLTPASYETLAAVLYNQPVTRAQVEAVRGVNSDGIMARLEERGYIEECGVLEQPGRPSVFKLTDQCMLDLGIESVEDLKPTELLMYENIRTLEEGIE